MSKLCVSGFLLAHNTSTDKESIYTADDKQMKCKDGIYRGKWADGDSTYGTTIFDKGDLNGEENIEWRLFKFANGDIIYEEKVWVFGKDKEWRLVTHYKFDDTSLEWVKVE